MAAHFQIRKIFTFTTLLMKDIRLPNNVVRTLCGKKYLPQVCNRDHSPHHTHHPHPSKSKNKYLKSPHSIPL